jgi:hypothetical protein
MHTKEKGNEEQLKQLMESYYPNFVDVDEAEKWLKMPFFHRIIILLYQSENTITNVVFRYAAERKEKLLKFFQ